MTLAAIGAGAGLAVGGLACAVIVALDEQDRARIRQAQIEAAAQNRPRYVSYQGKDGRQRTFTARPKPVTDTPQITGRLCRAVETDATVQGAGQAQLPEQLVCRTSSGDWVPAAA